MRKLFLSVLLASGLMVGGCEMYGADGSKGSLELEAAVKYHEGNFSITNVNDFDWTQCTFVAGTGSDGKKYRLEKEKIEARKQYVISASEFSGDGNAAFNPFDSPPSSLAINCHTPSGADSLEKDLSVEKDLD